MKQSRNQEVASKLATDNEQLRVRYFWQVGVYLLNEHYAKTIKWMSIFTCLIIQIQLYLRNAIEH